MSIGQSVMCINLFESAFPGSEKVYSHCCCNPKIASAVFVGGEASPFAETLCLVWLMYEAGKHLLVGVENLQTIGGAQQKFVFCNFQDVIDGGTRHGSIAGAMHPPNRKTPGFVLEAVKAIVERAQPQLALTVFT